MKYLLYILLTVILLIFDYPSLSAQNDLKGRVMFDGKGLEFVTLLLEPGSKSAITDSAGHFRFTSLHPGQYVLRASLVGFKGYEQKVEIPFTDRIEIEMVSSENGLDEIVVSGTLSPMNKMDSPVPVEVYNRRFFKANPVPSVFEGLQLVNGVRPQLNCSVCNTGDIHINGLEGPYTMVLIDGMPIVSGLSSVYGLTGVPQGLIERVEIVKGPASALYGSEAVGGLVNIITRNFQSVPIVSADFSASGWGELNTEIGLKTGKKKLTSLLGINHFYYGNPIDKNNDGFTDLTLQHRISIFNKWNLQRKENRIFSVAARYVYEDRWGGQTNWTPEFRGGDSVYGESIYTNRWELLGVWQAPVKEDIKFFFSGNGHYQNAAYGTTHYLGKQYVAFGQLLWDKEISSRNKVLTGLVYRYIFYDDNTVATAESDSLSKGISKPDMTQLPGAFVQWTTHLSETHTLLLGGRYDYNHIHGNVFTPRINWKWQDKHKRKVARLGAGNGYRVANVFTEDHAALTGARKLFFEDKLKPEKSWNINANYVHKFIINSGSVLSLDASAWYTYFSNRIVADYETNPNMIIYRNLSGYSESKGVSLSVDFLNEKGLTVNVGATWMDVAIFSGNVKTEQLLTGKFSATWIISYMFPGNKISLDYTGNLYSPMRLPLLGPLDPRPAYSSWFSIQNIQGTIKMKKQIEIYGGVKNLFNFTPPANSIARAHDPFDKEVSFDIQGQVIPNQQNPNALTFDPTYVYASNQGIRWFAGLRWNIQQIKK